jgi:small-conductance mechanosensitive channel
MTMKRRWRGAGSCRRGTELLATVAVAALLAAALSAQSPTAARTAALTAAIGAEPSGESATLVFYNRPIVTFRARVLGRGPAERAEGAVRTLDDLVANGNTTPVDVQSVEGSALVSVAGRTVFALTPPDLDLLAGETAEAAAAAARLRLVQALDEAAEARTVPALMRSSGVALIGLTIGLLAMWTLRRLYRIAFAKVNAVAERTVTKSGLADLAALRASRLLDVERWLLQVTYGAVGLVVAYTTLTFVLRRFPYTRPWGESMLRFLIGVATRLGLGIINALPNLFVALIILLIARFCIRVVALWFHAVEHGRVTPRFIYPETAQPTRRLMTALIWLFALIMAYPYLPGSQTEAFKGVTVFVGLMVTFGSTGLVNHIMSGFMITYSRALRIGDFVRIGEVEGTVTHLGVLSTKLKTLKSEDVTIPNAVVVAQTITDYSRFGDTEGVFTPISVTIGYDAPWRQVQALLLRAAELTPGLRRNPAPLVLQTSLDDFYVKYTLLVCLERQQARPFTLHTLHAHIQDVFNQYGVQIMSPNYVVDPAAPKVVPKKDWFAAPAGAAQPFEESTAAVGRAG